MLECPKSVNLFQGKSESIEPMSVKEGAKVTKYRFHLTIFSHREVEKLSTKNKHNERLCEDVVMRLYDEKMKG